MMNNTGKNAAHGPLHALAHLKMWPMLFSFLPLTCLRGSQVHISLLTEEELPEVCVGIPVNLLLPDNRRAQNMTE